MNMRLEDIKAYSLKKWKAYEDHPFGDIPICYKLNGKVFAQIYPKQEDFKMTLKCTADAGQFYRQGYPGVVVGGITVRLCSSRIGTRFIWIHFLMKSF